MSTTRLGSGPAGDGPSEYRSWDVWPLTGRDGYVERLQTLLRRRRSVVLAGPAGAGKTRLLEEVSRRLARMLQVVEIRATVATATLPFGAVASLLPEPTGQWREPSELLRAVERRWRAESHRRPVVVVVDDAHLLDGGSGALLQHLVDAGCVTALFTVRQPVSGGDVGCSSGPTPSGDGIPVLIGLYRNHAVEWIDLPPLAPFEVVDLLEKGLAGRVDGASAQRLVDASGGDVLLLRELLAAAWRTETLTCRDGRWYLTGPMPVGPRIEMLVHERIGVLTRAALESAEVVACGEPVDEQLLRQVASAEGLAAAERAGLVRLGLEDGRWTARIAHPLYGDLLRARAPHTRVEQVRGELARALVERGIVTDEDALRAAVWTMESGALGSEIESGVVLRAARRAAALLDHKLARRLALHAESVGAGAEALWLAALASLWLGETDIASRQLAAAVQLAGDETQRDTMRIALAGVALMAHGDAVGAAAILDAGHDLPPGGTALRAMVHLTVGEVPAALAVLDGVDVTDSRANVADRAGIIAGRTAALAISGRPAAAVEVCARFEEEVRDVPHAPIAAHLLNACRVSALHLSGEIETAERVLTPLRQEAARAGADEQRAIYALLSGAIAADLGSLDQARNWLTEAVLLLRAVPTGYGPSGLAWAIAILARVHGQRGDADRAEVVLSECESGLLRQVSHPEVGLGRAWSAAARGDLVSAAEIAAAAANTARRAGAGAHEARALAAVASFGAVGAAGRPVDLRSVTSRLAELGARPGSGSLLVQWRDAAAAWSSGDPVALLAAARAALAAGRCAEAADLATGAVRSARLTDQAGLADRAIALRREVLAARPDAATILGRLPSDAAVLTRRELQIALLVAGNGMSSRDVAAKLSISGRTVENHLQHVYSKLGVSTRVALAVALGVQG